MVLAHQDAWRSHPFISNCAKKPFTGLGLASAIFGVYLVVDGVTSRFSSKGKEGGEHPEMDYVPRGKFKYERSEVGEAPSLM
ncbi:putative mitochondrial protein [Phytophthora megakarya]|uniref:Putative mitochondrial protein n=1 Tax=Phytophthora megakarya TaxID=4795 RepID=A0A225WZD4_9STRA|nr:putative mitochondrial protein [Phytophthora megakarya]